MHIAIINRNTPPPLLEGCLLATDMLESGLPHFPAMPFSLYAGFGITKILNAAPCKLCH
ncbi:hypothetical protein [Chitinimonas taiwanensis]|uniref:hypothetical protein n=1 Tax=Chitinimonas taiwanensis TaxID=240412 RepID=UPI0015875AD9|nr:hypothetical protein [Chitinimonas taiwanensis]